MTLRRILKGIAVFGVWATIQQLLIRNIPWTLPEHVYSGIFSFLEWCTPGHIPYPEDEEGFAGLIVFATCSVIAALLMRIGSVLFRAWTGRRSA